MLDDYGSLATSVKIENMLHYSRQTSSEVEQFYQYLVQNRQVAPETRKQFTLTQLACSGFNSFYPP